MKILDQKQAIGEMISNRRKILKIEQSDVEDYTGISIGTISKLENGKGNISLENLLKILDILGLELSLDIKQTV